MSRVLGYQVVTTRYYVAYIPIRAFDLKTNRVTERASSPTPSLTQPAGGLSVTRPGTPITKDAK